jgi:hypothetical protein
MDDEQRSDPAKHVLSRRAALKNAAALATAMGTLELVGRLAHIPERVALASVDTLTLPDIQFDIGAFIAPARSLDGILMQLPPVNTVFLTGRLLRTPNRTDQAEMARAMNTLEAAYPFSASGLISFVAYGIPYFNRLPGGMTGSLVAGNMPRLLSNTSRFALEEAVPSPTDVSPVNPNITKLRFNVPVRIETNDVLFTLRSDDQLHVFDAVQWLSGSNRLNGQTITSPAFGTLLSFTSSRAMFAQIGMPRFVAGQVGLPFKNFINPNSVMWMGFNDQHVSGAGPAPICTFAGNSSARLTTAVPGNYFDNGGIQHLSHLILDMLQLFDMDTPSSPPGEDGVFTERVQYMFRSPAPSQGNPDQFTNGGGPANIENVFKGVNDALNTAQGIGTENNEHRMGHLSTLQRSSRAADGTPMHIRMDGPGFDNMDVPGASKQPKLQFTVFVPTADFFTTMRRNQASLDLQQQFNVPPDDNGLERFLTATRRQNFLVPPRRHRAFPLVEFT